MKKYMLVAVVYLMGCLTGFTQFSEDEMLDFEDFLSIADVNSYDEKDRNRNKVEILEVGTLNDDQAAVLYDMSNFQLEMMVMLTDGDKNNYLAQAKVSASQSEYDDWMDEYTGEDYWFLYMPYGDFEKLKVSAYIVRFGVINDGEFVPISVEEDDSEDILEGMKKGTLQLFPGQLRVKHYYTIDDPESDSDISNPAYLRLKK